LEFLRTLVFLFGTNSLDLGMGSEAPFDQVKENLKFRRFVQSVGFKAQISLGAEPILPSRSFPDQ